MGSVPAKDVNSALRVDWLVSVVLLVDDANAGDVATYVAQLSAELTRIAHHHDLVIVSSCQQAANHERIDRMLESVANIQVYSLAYPVSLSVAAIAGLERTVGDMCLVLDPASDPIALVPRLLSAASSGHDVVHTMTNDAPLLQRIGRRLRERAFTFLTGHRKLSGIALPRLLSRRALSLFLGHRDRFTLFDTLPAQTGLVTASISYEPTAPPRWPDSSSTARRLGTLVASSRRPFRLMSSLALLTALFNIAYAGYVLLVRFVRDDVVEGWSSLSLQSALMFFLLFTLIAALTEAVGHLVSLFQTQDRYHIFRQQHSALLEQEQQLNVMSGSRYLKRHSDPIGESLKEPDGL